MSFVGEPFEHDLFIGYSHGADLQNVQSGDPRLVLRDWTRRVANELAQRLILGFSRHRNADFKYYLDQQEPSAIRLEDDIKQHAKSSALMLIFLSPTYLRSEWSGKEVGWFFEQAELDGRGLDHCVLRMAQPSAPSPDCPWPPQLLDSAGKPVTQGEPFFNPKTDNPIELHGGTPDRPFIKLDEPIDSLAAEIKTKLERLKEQIKAKRAVEPPPRMDERVPAIVYVQSYNDADRWTAARQKLEEVATVLPDTFEALPDNLPMIETFRARRQKALVDCNGLVLLRSNPADPVAQLARSSQFDRRVLQETANHLLPWVLVDFVGDADPNALKPFTIPTVAANEEKWAEKALKAMNLS